MAIIKRAQMIPELSGSFRQGRGARGICNQGQGIVDRVFKTTLASGLSYVPSTGRSKHDRTKETQVALG